jgi:hypothetical protein
MKNKISIEAVKYRDMPSKQWYMSPNHTDWYYHSERMYPSSDLNPQFLDSTLDEPLRLLALGLNSLGYTTLPSCSGHYKDQDDLDEAYANLISDAKLIRGTGLKLTDVESGDKLTYKDSSWYLPWDKQTFSKISSGKDGKPEGYLGFCVPKKDAYKVGRVVNEAVLSNKGSRYEVQRKPEGYIFELRAYTGKQKTQNRVWENLGDDIMSMLLKGDTY